MRRTRVDERFLRQLRLAGLAATEPALAQHLAGAGPLPADAVFVPSTRARRDELTGILSSVAFVPFALLLATVNRDQPWWSWVLAAVGLAYIGTVLVRDVRRHLLRRHRLGLFLTADSLFVHRGRGLVTVVPRSAVREIRAVNGHRDGSGAPMIAAVDHRGDQRLHNYGPFDIGRDDLQALLDQWWATGDRSLRRHRPSS